MIQRGEGERFVIKQTPKERLLNKVQPEPNTGCWFWLGAADSLGYGRIGIGGSKVVLSHRLSYQLFKGPVPEDLCVLHKCDTPCCVNPDHLFLGTKKDNAIDCATKYRTNPKSAKLNHESVRQIRSRFKSGASIKTLVQDYNLARETIREVVTGKTWKQVT